LLGPRALQHTLTLVPVVRPAGAFHSGICLGGSGRYVALRVKEHRAGRRLGGRCFGCTPAADDQPQYLAGATIRRCRELDRSGASTGVSGAQALIYSRPASSAMHRYDRCKTQFVTSLLQLHGKSWRRFDTIPARLDMPRFRFLLSAAAVMPSAGYTP
jgi:hypothetical protein